MHPTRKKYMETIQHALKNRGTRLILLTGPRDCGKMTMLKQLYEDEKIAEQKHYFAFDQDIVSKQFSDVLEFKVYMEIKLGIDFKKPTLLLLNEIQHSKDIIQLLIQLVQDKNTKTKIIATSVDTISPQVIEGIEKLATIIHIYPLDFFEYLQEKGIHTEHFSLSHFSKVMLHEIQPYFTEYLVRGGYPAVVGAVDVDAKKGALAKVSRRIFEKDASFWFHGDNLLLFEKIISSLFYTVGTSYKVKQLQSQIGINQGLLLKYLSFFTRNHLFFQVPHFRTNKHLEVTHQKKIFAIDTGLLSFFTDNYSLKIKNEYAMMNFIFQEIFTNKRPDDEILSYKKINMSHVDFILKRADGSIVPISIAKKDSRALPKITESFLSVYGDRISHRIKLCPFEVYHKEYKKTNGTFQLHIIPQCMTKQLFTCI